MLKDLGRLLLSAVAALLALILLYVGASLALAAFVPGLVFLLGPLGAIGLITVFAALLITFYRRFTSKRLLAVIGLLVGGIVLLVGFAFWYFRPTLESSSGGAVSGGIAVPIVGIALAVLVVSIVLLRNAS